MLGWENHFAGEVWLCLHTSLNPREWTRGLRAAVMEKVEFGFMIRMDFWDIVRGLGGMTSGLNLCCGLIVYSFTVARMQYLVLGLVFVKLRGGWIFRYSIDLGSRYPPENSS